MHTVLRDLELELQAVMGHRGVLGTKPLSSAAECTLLHRIIQLAAVCTSLIF